MNLEALLDSLHARVVKNSWLQRFTVLNRLLLAVAFIPSGLVKIQGRPFTSIGPEHPIGYFFDALHQAGAYYNFLGWGQLLAAALLLLPRTATLGALVYFPIILNITVVTYALSFAGTWVITSLMLLANVYLLCWEYDRLKLLFRRPQRPAMPSTSTGFGGREYVQETTAWAGLGALGYVGLATLRVANVQDLGLPGAALASLAGAVFGLALAWHVRHAFPG